MGSAAEDNVEERCKIFRKPSIDDGVELVQRDRTIGAIAKKAAEPKFT